MKQIKFEDLENNSIHGGIMLDNGDVICGCCGGLFEADEQGDTWRLIQTFDWVDIDNAILDGPV